MLWERLKILEKEEKITNKPSKKGNSFFLPKGNLNKTKTIPKKTASCLNQNMISRTTYDCKKYHIFFFSYLLLEIIFWFKQDAVLRNRFCFISFQIIRKIWFLISTAVITSTIDPSENSLVVLSLFLGFFP